MSTLYLCVWLMFLDTMKEIMKLKKIATTALPIIIIPISPPLSQKWLMNYFHASNFCSFLLSIILRSSLFFLAQDEMPLSQLAALGVLLSHGLLSLSAPVLTFLSEYDMPRQL